MRLKLGFFRVCKRLRWQPEVHRVLRRRPLFSMMGLSTTKGLAHSMRSVIFKHWQRLSR